MKKWPGGPAQQFLPGMEEYFPEDEVYKLAPDIKNIFVHEPDTSPVVDPIDHYKEEMQLRYGDRDISRLPPWQQSLCKRVLQGEKFERMQLTDNWIPEKDLDLGGHPIYMDLSRRPVSNEIFIRKLNETIKLGGGIIIYLAQGDDYANNGLLEDMGYHYALIGIDMNQEYSGNYEYEKVFELDSGLTAPRILYGNFIMPLPILAELMGYVDMMRENLGVVDLFEREIGTEATIPLGELLQILNKLLNGNVRFGLRSDWSDLFHEKHKRLMKTEELLNRLYSGPKLPRDENDTERIDELGRWIDEQIINAEDTMWHDFDKKRFIHQLIFN